MRATDEIQGVQNYNSQPKSCGVTSVKSIAFVAKLLSNVLKTWPNFVAIVT